MSTVHVLVPHGVDDPTRPSGGNTYDRQACRGLTSLGWSVREHRMTGEWPLADGGSRAGVSATLRELPGGAVVLVDGLIASAAPEVLVPQADRLRLVILVHLPLGVLTSEAAPAPRDRAAPPAVSGEQSKERAVLRSAAAVVATSGWTRDWLLATYDLPSSRVHVAPPGAEHSDVAPGSATGGRLVAVGAVTATKGQDLLVAALAAVADLGWSCTCVGSTMVEPGFAERVRAAVQAAGVAHRVRIVGPRVGRDLDGVYRAADLVVVPSRMETYGLVVTEALARGIPVIGAEVGGLPEALGRTPGGRLPGILVPPADTSALATALRRWLTDSQLRHELRRRARERRAALSPWATTAERLSDVLAEVAA